MNIWEKAKKILSPEAVTKYAIMVTAWAILSLAPRDSIGQINSGPATSNPETGAHYSPESVNTHSQLFNYISSMDTKTRKQFGVENYQEGDPFEPDPMIEHFYTLATEQTQKALEFRQALMDIALPYSETRDFRDIAFDASVASPGQTAYIPRLVILAMTQAKPPQDPENPKTPQEIKYMAFTNYLTQILQLSPQRAAEAMRNPAEFIADSEAASDALISHYRHASDCVRYKKAADNSPTPFPWESDPIRNPNTPNYDLFQILKNQDVALYNGIKKGTHYLLWYSDAANGDKYSMWLCVDSRDGTATALKRAQRSGADPAANGDGGSSYGTTAGEDDLVPYPYYNDEPEKEKRKRRLGSRIDVSFNVEGGLFEVTEVGSGIDWVQDNRWKKTNWEYKQAVYGIFNGLFGNNSENKKIRGESVKARPGIEEDLEKSGQKIPTGNRVSRY